MAASGAKYHLDIRGRRNTQSGTCIVADECCLEDGEGLDGFAKLDDDNMVIEDAAGDDDEGASGSCGKSCIFVSLVLLVLLV